MEVLVSDSSFFFPPRRPLTPVGCYKHSWRAQGFLHGVGRPQRPVSHCSCDNHGLRVGRWGLVEVRGASSGTMLCFCLCRRGREQERGEPLVLISGDGRVWSARHGKWLFPRPSSSVPGELWRRVSQED